MFKPDAAEPMMTRFKWCIIKDVIYIYYVWLYTGHLLIRGTNVFVHKITLDTNS